MQGRGTMGRRWGAVWLAVTCCAALTLASAFRGSGWSPAAGVIIYLLGAASERLLRAASGSMPTRWGAVRDVAEPVLCIALLAALAR